MRGYALISGLSVLHIAGKPNAFSHRYQDLQRYKNPEVLLHTSGFLYTGIFCQNSSCKPMTIIQIYAQVFGIISMPIFGIFLLSSVTGR